MTKEKVRHMYEVLTAGENIGDGTSITRVFLFDFKVGKREALRQLAEDGFEVEPTRCMHSHDCCGHWYHGAAHAGVVGGRTVVTQGWYQNV